MWNSDGREWDGKVLEVVSGSKDGAWRLKEMMGGVDSDGGKVMGVISKYFVDRYGFDKGE